MRKLQRDLKQDDIDVLLIDIHSEVGQAVLNRFAFEFTPTFIVYDARGAEIWRGGVSPDTDLVRRLTDRD